MTDAPVLDVHGLCVDYPQPGWRTPPRRVVSDVDLTLQPGRILALVGESGSGKSTIGNAVLGIAPVASGTVSFDGRDITAVPLRRRRNIAAELQVIFQDPAGSLNPGMTVGDILTEPLRVHRALNRRQADEVIAELLERVRLPFDSKEKYAGQFSGGQRQRIAIARAVSVRPKVIICDEPTSALDVSTQAAVLALLDELRRDLGVALLFITHDLAVVRSFADDAMVLNQGQVVERGTVQQICDNPLHPYTQALLAAVPVPDPIEQRRRRERRLATERTPS